jgi:transposase
MDAFERHWLAGRMFRVELYGAVRHAVMIDGLSHREAARRFGVHRNTISKMLRYSAPPGYRRREASVSPKLGPHIAWIEAVLESDRSVHAKQRQTAQRLCDRLRAEEGYAGGYSCRFCPALSIVPPPLESLSHSCRTD